MSVFMACLNTVPQGEEFQFPPDCGWSTWATCGTPSMWQEPWPIHSVLLQVAETSCVLPSLILPSFRESSQSVQDRECISHELLGLELEGTFLGRRECDHNTQLIFLLCVKWPGQGGIRYIQELNILLYKLLRDLPVGKPAFSWAFSVKRWHMEKGSPCQLWIFFVVRKSMLSCKIVLLNFYSPMMLLPSGDKKQ